MAGAQLVELNVSCPNLMTADEQPSLLGSDVSAMKYLAEVLNRHPDRQVLCRSFRLKITALYRGIRAYYADPASPCFKRDALSFYNGLQHGC